MLRHTYHVRSPFVQSCPPLSNESRQRLECSDVHTADEVTKFTVSVHVPCTHVTLRLVGNEVPRRTHLQLSEIHYVLIKPRPHQQQCRSNAVECYKSNDSFSKVDCCFDRLSFLATMSNEISSFRQRQNNLNTFSLFQFRLCQKDELSRKTRSTLLPKMATMSK